MSTCVCTHVDPAKLVVLHEIWTGYLLTRKLIKIVHAEKIYLRDVPNRTPTQEMKYVFACLRYQYLDDKRFELVDFLNQHFPNFKLID